MLLTLQEAHGLNVNLVLWCVWTGAHFGEPDGATLKSAMAIANEWDAFVVAPLRAVRRKLKNGVAGIADEALRDQVKAAELGAERALQLRLESFAAALSGAAGDRQARARRTLAAYARAARAAETPGFSISLLEEVIRLTVDSCVEG